MEIILNGADFSEVAVTKLTEGYNVTVENSYVTANGSISSSDNFSRTEPILITEDMRTKGIILIDAKSNSTYPAIVFFSSDTPSSSTKVGEFFTGNYNIRNVFLRPELIPQNATHFIINGNAAMGGIAYESYAVDVLPLTFSDGYINASGIWKPDENYATSQMIPVNADINYYLYGLHVSKYDENGVFIERILNNNSNSLIDKLTSFASNVAYIRVGGLKTSGTYFLKF